MIRRIIQIDEEKCTGCGICAEACHEGAIAIVDGKAKLMRDDFCDGFGDCLPTCPAGAITFIEKDTLAYNEDEVKKHKEEKQKDACMTSRCPGTKSRSIKRMSFSNKDIKAFKEPSRLQNWPVQIKLAPTSAPYFDGADLLIAADCTAYSYASFHTDFIEGRITLIGCPKLDMVDYSEKLTEIFKYNDIKSVTLVRMEVPCCGGLERAAMYALEDSGKAIPFKVVTISIEGKILD